MVGLCSQLWSLPMMMRPGNAPWSVIRSSWVVSRGVSNTAVCSNPPPTSIMVVNGRPARPASVRACSPSGDWSNLARRYVSEKATSKSWISASPMGTSWPRTAVSINDRALNSATSNRSKAFKMSVPTVSTQSFCTSSTGVLRETVSATVSTWV